MNTFINLFTRRLIKIRYIIIVNALIISVIIEIIMACIYIWN